MSEVRFDDVAALQGLVSEDWSPLGPSIRVTQSMIDAFGEVTNDTQWIHCDVERARAESPFGATVAHGLLVLSLATAADDGAQVHVVGFGSAINYGIEGLRFLRPVVAGSSIRCRRRMAAVRPKKTGTLVTYEVQVVCGEASELALSYQQLALYVP